MRKIDFTCKKVSIKDFIQCNYNLNESDYLIFSYIMTTSKGFSVKDLVEKTEKDRTTVQKILTKLLRKDLILKKQINLERGFMFIYFSKNKDNLITEIEENITSYCKALEIGLKKWKGN